MLPIEIPIFFNPSFCHVVFAWSAVYCDSAWYGMQDPLSLGIIGLMEVIPAVSLALFAENSVL
jgi:hypothetical protein